jgi:hypothetical protein
MRRKPMRKSIPSSGADEEGLPDEEGRTGGKGRHGGANLTKRLPMRSDQQYLGQGSCYFISEERSYNGTMEIPYFFIQIDRINN